ncbi:hypothetical protein GQ42DRAFT_162510 [Ramicandelaber brevisporus]|nr:hypothetical protein GQ42DRAFT_162510 [Ramicandelaber brevisporus]
MASVPKPLKFLRPHYDTLKRIQESWTNVANKGAFAEILSLLAMAYEDDQRISLSYRLSTVTDTANVTAWGHEYVLHLCRGLVEEYESRMREEVPQPTDDLLALALNLVPYLLENNAEADSVDLLSELEKIEVLVDYVHETTYQRVCNYMLSCVNLLPPPDNFHMLLAARSIYKKLGKHIQALPVAIRIGEYSTVEEDFEAITDPIEKKQAALILGTHQLALPTEDEELLNAMSNTHYSERFMSLARSLEILDAKTPDDVYKTHLENTTRAPRVDSARSNLASSIVNAFVNIGCGKDKLVLPDGAQTDSKESFKWFNRNKELGQLCSVASIGAILMWDIDNGLNAIDGYIESDNVYLRAGAQIAMGLMNIGVRHETDPAYAILESGATANESIIKVTAAFGLAMAYAGTSHPLVIEKLTEVLNDPTATLEVVSIAGCALGLVCVGSGNTDAATTIVDVLMSRGEETTMNNFLRFLCLGLGLVFFGRQEMADISLEILATIETPVGKQASTIVTACAYAGTGNVAIVQKLLRECAEHIDASKDSALHQAFAVLGVAIISLGEDVGSAMVLRMFNHLNQFGDATVRQMVPLAVGLMCASNPLVHILELLSKFSHDNDTQVAMNAIFALGLVGAGTNNARVSQMLRQLATYYQNDNNLRFVVRIAQGMLSLGKGTISLSPYRHDRQILSPTALGSLLWTCLMFTDSNAFVVGKSSYMLYALLRAVYPRFLITLDENLNEVNVQVRVGQAVDTVGQAGQPKAISGFQTHTTPVVLGYGERAELTTEEYIACTPVLEGFIILRKNPDWVDDSEDK